MLASLSLSSSLGGTQNALLNNYDMMIITPSKYIDIIEPLALHKQGIGIETRIKPVEEIIDEYQGRDIQEQIKYCIKDSIETCNITYVLLIGSFEDIPGRYTHIYFDEPFDYPTPDEWVFTSDFYYADVYTKEGEFSSWDTNGNDVFAEYHWNGNTDEIDLTPDVYLGRLACVDSIQVDTCVKKIISYENEKTWTKEWFTNLVLIAGDGIPFDPESIDESEYLQEFIIDIMDGFIPKCIWASNGMLHDAYNINNAIEEGAGFVFFNGHGFHDLWVTYLHNRNSMVPPGCYRTKHINELSNSKQLPIVISDACYHLQYDIYPDCFGWSFISNPNGGAIAFIGGSDTDLAYAGSRIVETGIEKLDLHLCQLYQNGENHLGDLWGRAIVSYEPAEGNLVDLLTIVQNHLFGDPSLQIADLSKAPLTPDPPIGPSAGNKDISYEFSIVTTDPEGDDVYYLLDWGDGSLSDWVGPYPSGKKCSISHTWVEKGSFQIRGKAKDVNGVQSEWSDPVDIVLLKAKNTLITMDYIKFLFSLIIKMNIICLQHIFLKNFN